MTGNGTNEVCLVMAVNDGGLPPILAQKHYTRPSAFTPENLLREARRQKRITSSNIPDICVLDPRRRHSAQPARPWRDPA